MQSTPQQPPENVTWELAMVCCSEGQVNGRPHQLLPHALQLLLATACGLLGCSAACRMLHAARRRQGTGCLHSNSAHGPTAGSLW